MKKSVLIFLCFLNVAISDEDDGFRKEKYSVKEIATVTNVKWKAECSSCHMLYLPGLLPERSWKKMMTGLEKHFGENAELDEKTRIEIQNFLIANSGDRNSTRRGQKMAATIKTNEAPLRISETEYFMRKHHELSSNVYKRKSIKSAANCIACHSGAEKGDFEEDRVRIPK